MNANKRLSRNQKVLLGTYAVLVSAAGIFMLQSLLVLPNPFFIIISDSMVPTLQVGDIVVLEKVQPQEIHKGDIIAYKPRITTIADVQVHRVLKAEFAKGGGLLYTTKGDANQNEDSFSLTYDDVLGRVLFKIPLVANVFSILQNPFVLLVVAFVVLRKFI